MTRFSERLQIAAKHAGVGETQTEIAGALGLKRQTVNHWFTKGAPEADNLALIEKRWGVNGEWLRSGEGEMLPQPAGLAPDVSELVRHYLSAPAKMRPTILSMVRAARKAIVTIGIVLPPFLSNADADAAVLHKQNCAQEVSVIHIACKWIMSWLRSLRFVPVAAFA